MFERQGTTPHKFEGRVTELLDNVEQITELYQKKVDLMKEMNESIVNEIFKGFKWTGPSKTFFNTEGPPHEYRPQELTYINAVCPTSPVGFCVITRFDKQEGKTARCFCCNQKRYKKAWVDWITIKELNEINSTEIEGVAYPSWKDKVDAWRKKQEKANEPTE